jgi:hypothetical protein
MTRAHVLAAWGLLCLASAAPALAKPAPTPPLVPLAMLPSVARVKVTSHAGTLVVVEEVNLPRGDWKGEPLDFWVAYGSPGPPRAIDAHLVPVADGSLEPEDAEPGQALAFDRAPRRPATAHPLLGREQMAGIVVHVPKDKLEKALTPGNMAALRIRSAIDVGDADESGGRSVVVRLGVSRGTPLTLGRIVVGAQPGSPEVARAEARLCGAEADTHLLAVALSPKPKTPTPPAEPSATREAPIAPVLVTRHAGDDLCVRWWTPPQP